MLAAAHRALVIHGNYLDDEEIALSGRKTRREMAVVYCPRTHAWFGHRRYPLEKMLAAGATVAVGTDSRASSPDLSLLAELRAVGRADTLPFRRKSCYNWAPAGRPRRWDGSRRSGSLEPGKLANLAVVALPDRDAPIHTSCFFDSDRPVVADLLPRHQVRPSRLRESG